MRWNAPFGDYNGMQFGWPQDTTWASGTAFGFAVMGFAAIIALAAPHGGSADQGNSPAACPAASVSTMEQAPATADLFNVKPENPFEALQAGKHC